VILAILDLHEQVAEQYLALSRVLLRVLAVQQVEQFPSMLLDGLHPPEDQVLPVPTDDSLPDLDHTVLDNRHALWLPECRRADRCILTTELIYAFHPRFSGVERIHAGAHGDCRQLVCDVPEPVQPATLGRCGALPLCRLSSHIP
jgi:hypothetical protein